MAAGSFIDKFSDGSGRYRRARPTYPPELIARLAGLAPGRKLAWDSGTGNGQAAVALADHFEAVVATDASARQISEAVQADRVSYRVEAAERVSLPDGSVDLAVAAQAMHWFDLDRFYAQVRRVLRPGGLLAAIGYAWLYIDARLDAAIEETLLEPMRSLWSPRNSLLWDGYRGIPFPGTEIRIGPSAIHLHWSLAELMDYVLTWSATRSWIAQAGEEPLIAARAKLEAVWGHPEQRRHVVMPVQARVARIG